MSVCAGFAPERDSLTFQTLSPFLGAFALVHWRRSPHSTVGSLAFGVLQFGSKSAFGPRKLWKNQEKSHFNRFALGKLNKDNKCLALVQRNNVKSDFTTDIASSNWWLSGLWCVCVCKSISNFLEIHTPVFERKVRVLAHLEGISLNLRSNYDFNTPASQFHVHLAGEMSDFIFSKVKDREAAHRGDFRPVRISRVQRKVKVHNLFLILLRCGQMGEDLYYCWSYAEFSWDEWLTAFLSQSTTAQNKPPHPNTLKPTLNRNS